MSLEPAASVIKRVGGPKAAAAIVNKHLSRIYRWTHPKGDRQGTGGLIPMDDAKTILEFARQNDIDLEPGDFFSAERLKAPTAEAQP